METGRLSHINLFAQPSFITGVARILDWGCTLNEYNQSISAEQADRYALISDWKAVSDDLWYAIHTYEQSLGQKSDEQHTKQRQHK